MRLLNLCPNLGLVLKTNVSFRMILRSENMSIFSYLNVPSAFLPLSEGYKPSPSWPKLDDGIHWINLYPVDNEISFPNTNLSDSDSSSGWCYLSFEELESDSRRYMFTMEEALEDQH